MRLDMRAIISLSLFLVTLCYEVEEEMQQTPNMRSRTDSEFHLQTELTGPEYVYGKRNTWRYCGGSSMQGYYPGTYWDPKISSSTPVAVASGRNCIPTSTSSMSSSQFMSSMESSTANNNCCLTSDSYLSDGSFDNVNAKLACFGCFDCWSLASQEYNLVSCNPTNGEFVIQKYRNPDWWFSYVLYYETHYTSQIYGWFTSCETSKTSNGPLPSCDPWFQSSSSGLDKCNLSFEYNPPSSGTDSTQTPSSWSSYTNSGVIVNPHDSDTWGDLSKALTNADGNWYVSLQGASSGIYQSYTSQGSGYKISFYARNRPTGDDAKLGVYLDNTLLWQQDLTNNNEYFWRKYEVDLPAGTSGNLGFKNIGCVNAGATDCTAQLDGLRMITPAHDVRLQPNFGDASSGPATNDNWYQQVPLTYASLGNPGSGVHANGYVDGHITKYDLQRNVGKAKCQPL